MTVPLLPPVRRTVVRRRLRDPEELQPEAALGEQAPLEPETSPPEVAPSQEVQRVEPIGYSDGLEEILATLRDPPLTSMPTGQSRFSPRVVAQPLDIGGMLDQMVAGYQSGLETRPPAPEVAPTEPEDEADKDDPAKPAGSTEGTKASSRVKVKRVAKGVGQKRVTVKRR